MRYWSFFLLFFACQCSPAFLQAQGPAPFLIVLGITQDGGYPQAGCKKSCCAQAWQKPSKQRTVSCVAWVDPVHRKFWLFDATPDMPAQIAFLASHYQAELAGIFITHAHMGHYSGLMHLGREALGAHKVPVFVLPRMHQFLTGQGPWSQLVALGNVELIQLQAGVPLQVADWFEVTPLIVPHRDEFSETAAFLIRGNHQSFAYLPDIDKWEKWDYPIEQLIRESNYCFLDGTFFDHRELPGRNMAEIPHPFIVESMARWENLPKEEKKKIHFIHLNHTNPLLQLRHPRTKMVLDAGFRIARQGAVFSDFTPTKKSLNPRSE